MVFSFRVAFGGNPIVTFLQRSENDLIEKAQAVVAGQRETAEEEEFLFIRHFSRLALLELGGFLVEVAVLIWVWYFQIMPWLALGLLVKNVITVGISAVMTRTQMDESGIFKTLLKLPNWVFAADRVSAFISGAGCLVIFLKVNELVPW